MAVKNAGATGGCSAYLEIIEIDFESLTSELNDDSKQKWASPEGAGGTS